jgi:excisionase family DNA binding protein
MMDLHGQPEAPVSRVLLTIDEAAEAMSLGRTLVYGLLRRGELRAIKVGRSRRAVADSLTDFVARQLAGN